MVANWAAATVSAEVQSFWKELSRTLARSKHIGDNQTQMYRLHSYFTDLQFLGQLGFTFFGRTLTPRFLREILGSAASLIFIIISFLSKNK